MNDQTPLIWTTLGNLPMASMQYATRWEETDEYTKLFETYSLDGQIVRESVHILLKSGLSADAIAQPI